MAGDITRVKRDNYPYVYGKPNTVTGTERLRWPTRRHTRQTQLSIRSEANCLVYTMGRRVHD